MTKKIAIIGYGFVGKAVEHGFKTQPFLCESMWPNKIKIIDPAYTNTTIEDLVEFGPDVTFICVPTPTNEDMSIDISYVSEALSKLQALQVSGYYVLKSTVTPDHIQEFVGDYRDRFIYNPEFLTEANSLNDFIRSWGIVVGALTEEAHEFMHDLYENFSNCTPPSNEHIGGLNIIQVTPVEASFIKYGINSFLATKVMWFNQFDALVSKFANKQSANNVISTMKQDPRIGGSHMTVPGPDGKYGFSGKCFPKDTAALLQMASGQVDLSVLKAAVVANANIHSLYEKDHNDIAQGIDWEKMKTFV